VWLVQQVTDNTNKGTRFRIRALIKSALVFDGYYFENITMFGESNDNTKYQNFNSFNVMSLNFWKHHPVVL
jgi:hypothetical protein